MSGFIKVSEVSFIAVHSMILLALKNDTLLTIQNIAYELDVSEAHLAKVLQKLVKAGLINSTRGPKGGFSLAKSADEISFLQVYEAVEGCLKAESGCPHRRILHPFKPCPLQHTIKKCSDFFMHDFFNKTLSEVLEPQQGQA